MPPKRGRPRSTDTNDAAILRRRELTALRTQRYRENRAAQSIQPPTSTEQQTQIAHSIIECGFEELEAAETLARIGLRVTGITIAQDADDAQLQYSAGDVNEHDTLYPITEDDSDDNNSKEVSTTAPLE